MADILYTSRVALDPATGTLVRGAQLQAYAVDDTAFTTPLPVTDPTGVPLAAIRSTDQGVTEPFVAQDHESVILRSGDYSIPIESIQAIRTLAEMGASAVQSVNGLTPDEAGDVQVEVSGTDDAGIGALVTDAGSATYAALTERFGVGFAFLDTDEPSTGIPDGTVIFRVAGGGTGPAIPVIYAEDTFARTVGLGWGTASGGGDWVAFPADDPAWSVGSGAGKYNAPGAGSYSSLIRLSSYSQSSVEVEGIVSQETGDVGSRFIKIYPRRIVGNEVHYNATISLRGPNQSRPLQVDLSLGKGVNIGDLQATVPGVITTGALGEMVRFKVQVIQEDAATTRVRARVWLDGSAEPATWQREATDTDAALQGAGDLMYLVQQQSAETIASEVRLHEITARSIV